MKPNIKIGQYLMRWYILPRNKYFNIYLHKFIGDDDDRALHDHPWNSLSIRLKGHLLERYLVRGSRYEDIRITPTLCYRPATFAHRLCLVNPLKPVWTLFITGSKIREWGFLCKKAEGVFQWVHWSKMTNDKGDKLGGCE